MFDMKFHKRLNHILRLSIETEPVKYVEINKHNATKNKKLLRDSKLDLNGVTNRDDLDLIYYVVNEVIPAFGLTYKEHKEGPNTFNKFDYGR